MSIFDMFLTLETRVDGFAPRIAELRELLWEQYQFDVSTVFVEVTQQEDKDLRQALMQVKDSSRTLLSLVVCDLKIAPRYAGLVSFVYDNYIQPYSLPDLEEVHTLRLHNELDDQGIRAVVHLTCLLLMEFFDLVLVAEEEIKAQPLSFQQTWTMMFGIFDERRFEYNGVRYWRGVNPAGMIP